MKCGNGYDLDAVAFDIDGTLYPSWKMTLQCIPFACRYMHFMRAFKKVRRVLHERSAAQPEVPFDDLFGMQQNLLAEQLGIDPDEAGRFIRENIYQGWQPYFARIKPYPYIHETMHKLKAAGLKIGILSDFPPEQKGTLWGLLPLCDTVIGSESTGALKPSHVPFMRLAESLAVPCERILYVGNSETSDIAGAAAVGMKTAYIRHPAAGLLGKKMQKADISFSNYRQFLQIML